MFTFPPNTPQSTIITNWLKNSWIVTRFWNQIKLNCDDCSSPFSVILLFQLLFRISKSRLMIIKHSAEARLSKRRERKAVYKKSLVHDFAVTRNELGIFKFMCRLTMICFMIRISRRSQSVKSFFLLCSGATLRVNRLWRLNGKRKHKMKSEMLWVIRGGFLKWQFVKDCCYFLMPAMVFIFVVVVSPPCAYLLCKLFSQISSSVKFFESSTARKTATGERRK